MRIHSVVEAGICIEIDEICLDTDADMALDSAKAALSAEERARAASFVFANDRDRFVRGRGHLRRRLGLALRMAAEAVPLAAGKDGKPFVAGHGIKFNLSNSGGRAVIALSSGGEVGIDLEIVDRWNHLDEQLDGLEQMCLTAEEQRAVAGLRPGQRVRRFLSFWTAKEARMKLTGEGFGLDPLDISLEVCPGAGPSATAGRARLRPSCVSCSCPTRMPSAAWRLATTWTEAWGRWKPMGRARDALKLMVGRVAEITLPGLGREVDEARETKRAPRLKRAIVYARLRRAHALGDVAAMDDALVAYWRGGPGDKFYGDYADDHFRVFLRTALRGDRHACRNSRTVQRPVLPSRRNWLR